jgi:hypothetical protein
MVNMEFFEASPVTVFYQLHNVIHILKDGVDRRREISYAEWPLDETA